MTLLFVRQVRIGRELKLKVRRRKKPIGSPRGRFPARKRRHREEYPGGNAAVALWPAEQTMSQGSYSEAFARSLSSFRQRSVLMFSEY